MTLHWIDSLDMKIYRFHNLDSSHPKVIFNLKGHICDCSIHIKSYLKSTLGQVGVSSNIAQNHSSTL